MPYSPLFPFFRLASRWSCWCWLRFCHFVVWYVLQHFVSCLSFITFCRSSPFSRTRPTSPFPSCWPFLHMLLFIHATFWFCVPRWKCCFPLPCHRLSTSSVSFSGFLSCVSPRCWISLPFSSLVYFIMLVCLCISFFICSKSFCEELWSLLFFISHLQLWQIQSSYSSYFINA